MSARTFTVMCGRCGFETDLTVKSDIVYSTGPLPDNERERIELDLLNSEEAELRKEWAEDHETRCWKLRLERESGKEPRLQ